MKNFDVGTIARTVFLVLSLVNLWLASNGISPLPFDESDINLFITFIATGLSWWYNNNFTHEARQAQKKLNKYKAQKKLGKSTGAPNNIDGDTL
ncbi:phage holin [Macrococcoides caseolyticum]|uniref:phage holin n=1 Tax=Macrococcoides caseolyticum TaxID=69966 RepID=UPI001F3648CF|nr:phage holin [Macrococcus caseolyticus]MCE4957246.1 phage holin [Macrococcus caseolyticus]